MRRIIDCGRLALVHRECTGSDTDHFRHGFPYWLGDDILDWGGIMDEYNFRESSPSHEHVQPKAMDSMFNSLRTCSTPWSPS